MNARSLIDLVKRRVPGYQDSEYLSELNDAYIDVWERILRLDNSWFEDSQVRTTAVQQSKFDMLFNTDGGLDLPVSPLINTISKIRVLPPNSSRWFVATPDWTMGSRFLSLTAPTPLPVDSGNGPYLYRLYGTGTLQFALSLQVGTQIEITFVESPLPLAIVSDGTVTKSSKVVTGTGSHFTDLLAPDLKVKSQPGVTDYEAEIQSEIILDARTYRVDAIASDTSLTVFTAPATLVANTYSLAVVPDLPPAHHRALATIATRNILSTPADDSRFALWASLAEQALQMVQNALASRQEQANPRKRPFRYRARTSGILLTSS